RGPTQTPFQRAANAAFDATRDTGSSASNNAPYEAARALSFEDHNRYRWRIPAGGGSDGPWRRWVPPRLPMTRTNATTVSAEGNPLWGPPPRPRRPGRAPRSPPRGRPPPPPPSSPPATSVRPAGAVPLTVSR